MIYDSTPPRDDYGRDFARWVKLLSDFPGLTMDEVRVAVNHMRNLAQSKPHVARDEAEDKRFVEMTMHPDDKLSYWQRIGSLEAAHADLNDRINNLNHVVANMNRLYQDNALMLNGRIEELKHKLDHTNQTTIDLQDRWLRQDNRIGSLESKVNLVDRTNDTLCETDEQLAQRIGSLESYMAQVEDEQDDLSLQFSKHFLDNERHGKRKLVVENSLESEPKHKAKITCYNCGRSWFADEDECNCANEQTEVVPGVYITVIGS